MATDFSYQSYFKFYSCILRIHFAEWDITSKPRKICFYLFFILFDMFSCLTMFWKCVLVFDNVKRFSECAIVFLHFPAFLMTVICNFKYRWDFQKILLMIEDPLFAISNEKEERMAKRALFPFKFLTYTAFAYTILLLFLVHIFTFKKNDYLAVAAWYPFDFSKSPMHQMVQIHQFLAMAHLGLLFLLTILLMFGFFCFIGLQCDLLSYNLENFTIDISSLKEIVKRHNLLLR